MSQTMNTKEDFKWNIILIKHKYTHIPGLLFLYLSDIMNKSTKHLNYPNDSAAD